MPIWDNTAGNVSYEIGSSIWDNTAGNVSSAVGTIWDNTAGNVSSVVWTAETALYPGAVPAVTTAYGSAGGYAGYSVWLSGATANSSTAQVYIPINVSGYKSLRVTYYVKSSVSGAVAGIYLHTSPYYPYYILRDNSYPQYWTRKSVIVNGSKTETITWDVSGLSGTYYLYAVGYLEAAVAATVEAQVQSVVGI